MKKLIAPVAVLLFLFTAPLANAQGIEFIHDKKFAELLQMAKQQNRLIFMDCYTSWCGPCKRLSSMVFPDSAVGEFFNENFINAKFDMEKDEGPTIAGNYAVRAYPTLLWLDGDGNVRHKIVGGLDVPGLIAQGKKAIDPTPGILTGMRKRYADGDRDVNFLMDFVNTLQASGEKYEEYFNEYMSKLSPKDLSDAKHAKTIFNLTNDIKSPGVAYLIKNKAYYKGMLGDDAYNNKIDKIAAKAAGEAPKANDPALFKGALDLIKSNKAPNAAEKTAQLSLDYYEHMADWNNYDKTASAYIKKYASKKASVLNDVAWTYYLNMNDDARLKKASKWAYTAINTDNKYTYNLTYAYLLYKLNDYKEAEKACDYAIIRAKEENVNPGSATFLKEAIQKSVAKEKQP
ncbi:MAG: thioredoxin domain-containing protein [Chitinophagales bacterium]